MYLQKKEKCYNGYKIWVYAKCNKVAAKGNKIYSGNDCVLSICEQFVVIITFCAFLLHFAAVLYFCCSFYIIAKCNNI